MVETNLRKIELCLDQVAIGVERIELGVDPALVTHVRKPRPILERCNQRLLLETAFTHALMCDQRIRNVGERRLNGLLILDERAFPLRLGELHVRLQTAGSEDWL